MEKQFSFAVSQQIDFETSNLYRMTPNVTFDKGKRFSCVRITPLKIYSIKQCADITQKCERKQHGVHFKMIFLANQDNWCFFATCSSFPWCGKDLKCKNQFVKAFQFFSVSNLCGHNFVNGKGYVRNIFDFIGRKNFFSRFFLFLSYHLAMRITKIKLENACSWWIIKQ